jgi:hypothetical protein
LRIFVAVLGQNLIITTRPRGSFLRPIQTKWEARASLSGWLRWLPRAAASALYPAASTQRPVPSPAQPPAQPASHQASARQPAQAAPSSSSSSRLKLWLLALVKLLIGRAALSAFQVARREHYDYGARVRPFPLIAAGAGGEGRKSGQTREN